MQSTGNWTRDYIYDPNNANRLIKHDPQQTLPDYTYDSHGNMLQMPGIATMEWDYENRLFKAISGTVTSFNNYEAGGERARKVVEKTEQNIKEVRIYFSNFEVYRKYVSDVLETERTTLHISDGQRRIAFFESLTVEAGVTLSTPQDTVRYQYDNHLGSSCLELDESANTISYEEYHPFGTSSYRLHRNSTEASLKRYRYVGKERDEETGLYYYGARYYAAWIARFVSVDPLQHKYPHYTPYQYAGNKPITFIDLDGLEEAKPFNQDSNILLYDEGTYNAPEGSSSVPIEGAKLGNYSISAIVGKDGKTIGYTAYNQEAERIEYTFGANSSKGFAENVSAFENIAKLAYSEGGGTIDKVNAVLIMMQTGDPLSKEAWNSGMEGTKQQWNDALKDPVFVTSALLMTANVAVSLFSTNASLKPQSEKNKLFYRSKGAERAAKYADNYMKASLENAIAKHAGKNATTWVTNTGKKIWENPTTGRQVVYDIEGDYFRIFQPKTIGSDKGKYLDLLGNIPKITKRVKGGAIKSIPLEGDALKFSTHFKPIKK